MRLGSEPEDTYINSRADGAAFAAEAFTFRKDQPIRGPNNAEFYYKRCSLDDGKSYYSKTSYECTTPGER